MASRRLEDLAPQMFLPTVLLLAKIVEAGIAVVVIETTRTLEEHERNLAAGRSWVKRSKHIDGLAIDLAPYDTYQLHGPDKLRWDSEDPVWQKIGKFGEELGFRWGGRWQQRDMGHFEYQPGLTLSAPCVASVKFFL